MFEVIIGNTNLMYCMFLTVQEVVQKWEETLDEFAACCFVCVSSSIHVLQLSIILTKRC